MAGSREMADAEHSVQCLGDAMPQILAGGIVVRQIESGSYFLLQKCYIQHLCFINRFIKMHT